MKKLIRFVRRPVAELLRRAHAEALRGNAEGLQRYLSEYLRDEAATDCLFIMPEKETPH